MSKWKEVIKSLEEAWVLYDKCDICLERKADYYIGVFGKGIVGKICKECRGTHG